MLKSIRWTLQIWHGTILVLALAGFGAASYFQVSRAQFKKVDTELETAAHVLASRLHAPPPPRQDRNRPPRPQDPPPRLEDDPQSPAGREFLPPPRRDPPRQGDREGGPDSRPPRPEDQDVRPEDRNRPFDGTQGRTDNEAQGRPDGQPGRPDDARGGPNGPPQDRRFDGPAGGRFDGPQGRPNDGPPGRRFDDRQGPPTAGPPGMPPVNRVIPGSRLPRGRQSASEQQFDIDLPPGFLQRFADSDADQPYFIIWKDNGDVIKASGPAPAVAELAEFDRNPREPSANNDGPVFRHRGYLHEVILLGPPGTHVLVGRSVLPVQAEMHRLIGLMALTGLGVLGVGLAGGWLLSRRAVRPIDSMSATAQNISATSLSQRIDVKRVPSELAALAGLLNGAFGRLEAAFLRQTRFTADASHELRTPLAVIHSHTQLALSRERTAGEYRGTIETCLKAAERMRCLIESLLLLARADAGGLELDLQPLDLRNVVEDAVGLLTTLAEEKKVEIELNLEAAEMAGDVSRLGQVVTNLVANAIRYNREGGTVSVSTTSDAQIATLTVADTGVGIAEDDQPRVFERFFRADKARARKIGGSGLGLAICQTIVEAHGGRITFTSKLGEGTVFEVRFPRAG